MCGPASSGRRRGEDRRGCWEWAGSKGEGGSQSLDPGSRRPCKYHTAEEGDGQHADTGSGGRGEVVTKVHSSRWWCSASAKHSPSRPGRRVSHVPLRASATRALADHASRLLSSLNLFHLPSPHRLLGNCNHVRDDHHHRIIAAIVRARERTDDALQGAYGDPAIHPELPLTGRAKERFFPAHLHVGRWRTEVHRDTHGPRYLLGTRR